MLGELKKFRTLYNEMRNTLPFLDCYVSDMAPSWDDVPQEPQTPFVKLSFDTGNPRLVKQTEHSFKEIEEMAVKNPEINFIIASGDQKMLYHITEVTRLIKSYKNIYLCTANVCNVFALEDLVAGGCTEKLLYGTMVPYLAPGQAMGPVVLGDFDWETRCAIAGNNFRKLLGESAILPPELPSIKIPSIIVDAHGHTISPDAPSRFPAPVYNSIWSDWEDKLNFFGITDFFITSSEAIRDVSTYCTEQDRKLGVDSGEKIRYFVVFDPTRPEDSIRVLENNLADPLCVGIKIHPACHLTDADAPEYELAYQLAAKFNKPIMTHSWGISDYNQTQKHATPDRFEVYFKKYPQVKFVLGHCGGRPNGFTHAVEMIRKYPQVMGDFAGDLFNNGFIAHAVKEIGVDRLIFATDMYWIDPRSVLGMIMDLNICDADMLKILRENALDTYNIR